jgi:hypothetical protein
MRRNKGRFSASLLLSLALSPVSFVWAGTIAPKERVPRATTPAQCDPDLDSPDYVGGVDVNGNRIVPADVGGGVGVDLSHVTVTPVMRPGGKRPDIIVQGVKLGPADPPCVSRDQPDQ